MNARKLQIVDAAVRCFLENGYHQTGMREIASKAGVSLGNLYNHFSGKEAVLAAIATLEAEELAALRAILSEARPHAEVLDRFITAYAEYVARPENALLGLEIVMEAVRTPAIGEIFSTNRARLVEGLSAFLAAGAQANVFHAIAEVEETALLLLDMLEGQGVRQLFFGGKSQPEQIKMARQFIQRAILR